MDYRNPILNADWPDLDAIRVDDEYYLVASSINRVPGLPILASPDLVNWRHLGSALAVLEPREHFALPRHGAGAWAPALRHHDGLFYLFLPDPDHGIFVLTATDAAGPWSAPHPLLPGLGLIDPCPLWDDDGRAYLVFAWARSRGGIANRLSVVEISPDARNVLGTPVTVIDGDDLPGYSTLEGPKFYRRDGWYWIFAPAGGVTEGWQSVFRSRSVLGPYEDRVVLESGGGAVNGPHQGAWVTSPEGEDWFLHFQDRGPFGRVVHLQPLRWGDDGWPMIGDNGRPVLDHPVPARAVVAAPSAPVRDDAFQEARLGPQWHWQANPADDWAMIGGGLARLRAVPDDLGSLRSVPQVLGQQLPGVASTFTTSLALDTPEPGCRAGVVVLGTTYAWLGLAARSDGSLVIRAARSSAGDEEVTDFGPLAVGETLRLRIRSDDAGLCSLEYATGVQDWSAGIEFPATAGQWISAELGLFACAPPAAAGTAIAAFGPVTIVDG
ncbi:glycoside hydrolase family 43 protein [Lacisediminihabitans sp. FW035]